MSRTFVMLLAAAATMSATLLSTSGTFFISPTTFLFLFATSPVDLGEKKVVESFFCRCKRRKDFRTNPRDDRAKMAKNEKLKMAKI